MYRTTAVVTTSTLLLTLAACGSPGSGGGDDTASSGDDTLSVTTSFYPLEYAAEQIGGENVSVSNLTPAGAEPHDVQLTPKQVLQASRADLLIYLSGFQPSIDDAVTQTPGTAFDVSDSARLDITAEGAGAAGSQDGRSRGNDQGAPDPHFWLDPTRYADVADAIAERFAENDPTNAEDYRANAKAFTARLADLDRELKRDLADCTQTDLVTSHAAFAYFADRYGFDQVPVSGLTPDAKPSPKQMADLITRIKDEDISTVYTEILTPRDLAETIARDSGADVAVLDPIAGVTNESAGSNYFEIMRSNRDAVRKGQDCR